MYFSEVFFRLQKISFYAIQFYKMLAYFEEEANRSEDLAIPYLQNKAPSTPILFFFLTRINFSFTRYQ